MMRIFRYFVEDCDTLQGFHLATDMLDGFGGFSSAFLESLRDDFPKTPVVCFACYDSIAETKNKSEMQRRLLNEVFAVTHLHRDASLFVPLYALEKPPTPFLSHYKPTRYHSSGILASFVDTASLIYRLKKESFSMGQMISNLNWRSNTKIAEASLSFPFPIQRGDYLEDVFTRTDEINSSFFPLSRQAKLQPPFTAYSESLSVRGLSTFPLFPLTEPKSSTMRFRKSQSAKDMLLEFWKDLPRTSSFGEVIAEPLNIPRSFPKFFDSTITEDGLYKPIIEENQKPEKRNVKTAPAISVLRISETSKSNLVALKDKFSKVNSHLYPAYFENKDLFDEMREDLENIISTLEN